jgi:hypothetical protein
MLRYTATGLASAKGFDDVWVLSLPQFVWTHVFEGVRPNYGPTCHVVGKKQMLFLGGDQTTSITDCAHKPYIGLFDMTNLKWLRGFCPEESDFNVPRAVSEWIGGS